MLKTVTGNNSQVIYSTFDSSYLQFHSVISIRKSTVLLIILFIFLPGVCFAETDSLKSSLSQEKKSQVNAQKSQKKIDELADNTQQMAADYSSTLRKIQSLQVYNAQLDKVVNSQKSEIDSLNRQLNEIDVTQKEIVPLVLKMVDTLEQFVQLDIPFLQNERKIRIDALRKLLDRGDVSISEKYRRVLEAYQIEAEYGRTIEAYEGNLPSAQNPRTVQLLRIGRLGLYYQALDGSEIGYWDKTNSAWVKMDMSFRKAVSDGIRIAKKQAAPDLLTLPVKFAEATK